MQSKNWEEIADTLILKYATADDSHAELMELLTANGVPREVAKPIVDEMRPDEV